MKTYSEEKGEVAFNWLDFLSNPKLTPNDCCMKEEAAYGWVTCACGNLCVLIPRNASGKPYDTILGNLGGDFYRAVASMGKSKSSEEFEGYRANAINVLNQIEQRSSLLLERIIISE